MALRDTLEYNRIFDQIPPDWRDREDPFSSSAGAFGTIDPSQSWIHDGRLVLGVKRDPNKPGHYLVGQVESETLFSPYGFWEARVKFPSAPGVLAGWWLQAESPYATPTDVEIDVAENAGNPNIWHTLWYRAEGAPWGQFTKVPEPALLTDLGTGVDEPQANWHDYGVRITPTSYTFFVDNVNRGAVIGRALTNTPHRMVFSLKVPDYAVSDLNPSTLASNRMKVQWVRKYAP